MTIPRFSFRASRAGLLVPIALAAATAGMLLGGPSGPAPGAAGDRFRAGEAATVRTELPDATAAKVDAHGLALARALGVPLGSARRAVRVVDRVAGSTYDEITTSDADGHHVGIVQMTPAGDLLTAISLGWQPAAGRAVASSAAASRGRALVQAAGVAVAGTPDVGRVTDDGWDVTWPRLVDGVPALGDGVRVTLFADGSFHAMTRRERPLATAPETTLTRSAVEQAAGSRLVSLLGQDAAAHARIAGTQLAWVAPNDTFDGSRPDAADPVLRLAWVVQVSTDGPLAEQLRALELYLDAGSGDLLGGDVLR